MQLHRHTSALSEAGGLTEAIMTLRASDPDFARNPGLLALRRALADRIETDIATLDLLGGDPDFEPSLGAPNPFTAGPALDWIYGTGDDREADPAEGPEGDDEREHESTDDNGIGDHAGAWEQYGEGAHSRRGFEVYP